ncbi:hypothetical protein B0T22DRAFT_439767 [Podospora appendiculata]|uniref:Uncharacterized protein n=1 Tax=Podospora appendiculata TaxID=314037 RepID=A0AAE0X8Y0_9PEZI|nr:hypothetical protein B0T22DRAFT_439767 [Podospora appendiculata]
MRHLPLDSTSTMTQPDPPQGVSKKRQRPEATTDGECQPEPAQKKPRPASSSGEAAPTTPPPSVPPTSASSNVAEDEKKPEDNLPGWTPGQAQCEGAKEGPDEPSPIDIWDDEEEEDLKFGGTFFHRAKEDTVKFSKAIAALEETRDDSLYPMALFGDGSFHCHDSSHRGVPGAYATVYREAGDGWGELAAICEELNLVITRIEHARKLKSLGAKLEVHHLPGHGHDVVPFRTADTTSRTARTTRASTSSLLTVGGGALQFQPIGQKLADKTLKRVDAYKQAVRAKLIIEMAPKVSDKDKRRLTGLKVLLEIDGQRGLTEKMKKQMMSLKAKVGHLLPKPKSASKTAP